MTATIEHIVVGTLEAFGETVDDEGFIIDAYTGDRLTHDDGSYRRLDDYF